MSSLSGVFDPIRFALEDVLASGSPGTVPAVPGVYLYALTNFRGESRHLTQSVPDLAALDFSERVSSWAVVGDYSATGFVEKDYAGARSTLWADSRSDDMRKRYLGVGTPGWILVDTGLVNNTMSSIGIGSGSLNAFDNPLYWPRGAWVDSAGTAGGTTSWRFHPDRSYLHLQVLGSQSSRRTGKWRLAEGPYGLANLLVTYESTVESPVGQPAGSYPAEAYPYRWEDDGRVLAVNMGVGYTRYTFVPE